MFHRQMFPALLAFSALAVFGQQALAQSGTRTKAASSPTSRPGSASRAAQSPVALDGYCPVCVIEMKKWLPGKPELQVTYDGKAYYFPGDEQKQMFLTDPAKYTPALGGDCTVCAVNMGQRMAGKVQFPMLYANRLFLFPNEAQRKMFLANPAKYAVKPIGTK